MITQFKIFENVKKTPYAGPYAGDYVIFNLTEFKDPESSIVAKVSTIPKNKKYPYFVNWLNYGTAISLDNIIDWSSDKEELELKLQANKYNL